MKQLFLLFAIVGSIFQATAQVRTDTLEITDPVFNRPTTGAPPTGLSLAGAAVYYKVYSVPVTVPGVYTFEAASVFDNFGILYDVGGFDPLDPLTNAIEANDDALGLDFSITQTLSIGTYYLVVTSFSDGEEGEFSITTTGPGTVILPLNLLDFQVKKTSEDLASVSWITSAEKDVSHFELQQTSGGANYSTVARVNATNNVTSNANNLYTINQVNLKQGKNIFRLKMVDQSGDITYSNAKMISVEKENEVKLYPNPAGNIIKFSLFSASEEVTQVRVTDLSGRLVMSQKIVGVKGIRVMPLDISSLQQGLYILHWQCGENRGVMKFQKD